MMLRGCFLFFLGVVGVTATNWVDDVGLQTAAELKKKKPMVPPKVTLNLDLPEQERWVSIAANYKDKAPALMAYLEAFVPKWLIPVVELIGKDIRPYFRDYGDEMIGVADAMGLKIGDVVVLNLVYQLERMGINCSNWNNTGSTIPNDPGCEDVDPSQKICYCKANKHLIDIDGVLRREQQGPGLCTSVVAQDDDGTILHGRNLDWNLPAVLRELVVDIDFQRNNKTIFVGTGLVGFVGLLNGMRYDGNDKGVYSVSIDARDKGGRVFENVIEALFHKAMTPSQHLRKTFENQVTWDTAIADLSTGPLVDEIYYICAGNQAGQGLVMSRDRNNGNGALLKPADQWKLGQNDTNDADWFRLQTNYDHWNPVPVADNRRDPGVKMMKAMGQPKLNGDSLLTVMHTWPVFNSHTDYTGLFVPAAGTYQSTVWMGE